jgi:hypothetical protein
LASSTNGCDSFQSSSRSPPSTSTTDTITTAQHSEVPCLMENYRSNASPFGLGWRKSPHESPHTHTSLFPIPMQLVKTKTMSSEPRPSCTHWVRLNGFDGLHGSSRYTQSIVPTRQVIIIGHDDRIQTLHSRIPRGLDCPSSASIAGSIYGWFPPWGPPLAIDL